MGRCWTDKNPSRQDTSITQSYKCGVRLGAGLHSIFPVESSGPVFGSALGSTGPVSTHPFTCRSRACEHPSHAKQPSQSPLTHQSSSVPILIHPSIHPSIRLPVHTSAYGTSLSRTPGPDFPGKTLSPTRMYPPQNHGVQGAQAGAQWVGHMSSLPSQDRWDHEQSRQVKAPATVLKAASSTGRAAGGRGPVTAATLSLRYLVTTSH